MGNSVPSPVAERITDESVLESVARTQLLLSQWTQQRLAYDRSDGLMAAKHMQAHSALYVELREELVGTQGFDEAEAARIDQIADGAFESTKHR